MSRIISRIFLNRNKKCSDQKELALEGSSAFVHRPQTAVRQRRRCPFVPAARQHTCTIAPSIQLSENCPKHLTAQPWPTLPAGRVDHQDPDEQLQHLACICGQTLFAGAFQFGGNRSGDLGLRQLSEPRPSGSGIKRVRATGRSPLRVRLGLNPASPPKMKCTSSLRLL